MGTRGAFAVAAAAGAMVVTGAAPALADTPAPRWNCRASLAYVALQGLDRIEPVVANGTIDPKAPDRPQCADDATELPTLNQGPIAARLPWAATAIDPDVAATKDQKVTGSTGAADIAVDAGGQFLVKATGVRSDAAASCVNGQPKLDGASTVLTVSVNGQSLPVDGTLTQITQPINGSPLSALARAFVNRQDRTGDAGSASQSLTQTALRVELLNAGGGPIATVVAGETKVARSGSTCASTQPSGGGNGNGGNDSGTGSNGNAVVGGSANSTRPLVNGTNGGCGHLRMYFDRNHRTAFASRYGARAVVRGRVVSCKGKPIVGARILVYHLIKGHKRLIKTGLRSRPGGKLTLILPLNIRSRDLLFIYRGYLDSTKTTSQSRLHITVRNRNGRVLR